jgi:endoglucanase
MKILIPFILCFWMAWGANAQSEERLRFVSITPSEDTGQDYTPWLSDDLDSLVESAWQGNFKYVDITLLLEKKSQVKRLSFYDHEGVFTDNPALIYALNGTEKVYLGKFEGLSYKTMVDLILPEAVTADAILIHKYCNNIPQKIFAYGTPLADPVEPEPAPQPVPAALVKIPIDPARWYQLNTPSPSLEALFDGVTDVNVELGWGKMFSNYDAYYAVEEGEEITLESVKFYDWQGQLGDYPMTLSVITNDWQRVPVATFNGSRYDTWVGPYPDRETTGEERFRLDSTYHNIRFLVLNLWSMCPTEIEFYGQYKAPAPPAPAVTPAVRLSDTFGINGFEWDFLKVQNGMEINEAGLQAARAFRGVRHYMDWEKLESNEGSYTFSPVHSGGWNYDLLYQRLKSEGMEVLACLKTIPGWMQNTYPETMRDLENVPARYGKDLSDPNSYIEQAKVGFQYIARYGSNTQVDTSLLRVNENPRWTDDPVNTVKVGLGLIKYIECDNERDKWWKGRKAYQTAYEYAANLSAFYDGHKNTMGPGVGVKNADPSVQVVMAGLASPGTDYVRGMIDWCKQNRGFRPDGSVNLCWDVINYHYYANDSDASQAGNSSRGVAPELSGAAQVADQFVQLAHRYVANMPVWITEAGYDLNQDSPMNAIPIGNKTAEQTQADWTLRSSLLYARSGIQKVFHYQMYDDNPHAPVQFGSMGMLNGDLSRRAAADYLFQVNKVVGAYTYDQTISQDPLVDRYVHDGKEAYVLVVPDETGRTATYSLTVGSDSVRIYTPRKGGESMGYSTVAPTGGKVQVQVSETPVFVLKASATTGSTARTGVAELEDKGVGISIYPNPTANVVYLRAPNELNAPYELRVYSASGKMHRKINRSTPSGIIRERIDLSALPAGMYFFELIQGDRRTTRKVIRTN